jgi:hypothetical protein
MSQRLELAKILAAQQATVISANASYGETREIHRGMQIFMLASIDPSHAGHSYAREVLKAFACTPDFVIYKMQKPVSATHPVKRVRPRFSVSAKRSSRLPAKSGYHPHPMPLSLPIPSLQMPPFNLTSPLHPMQSGQPPSIARPAIAVHNVAIPPSLPSSPQVLPPPTLVPSPIFVPNTAPDMASAAALTIPDTSSQSRTLLLTLAHAPVLSAASAASIGSTIATVAAKTAAPPATPAVSSNTTVANGPTLQQVTEKLRAIHSELDRTAAGLSARNTNALPPKSLLYTCFYGMKCPPASGCTGVHGVFNRDQEMYYRAQRKSREWGREVCLTDLERFNNTPSKNKCQEGDFCHKRHFSKLRTSFLFNANHNRVADQGVVTTAAAATATNTHLRIRAKK